MTTIINGSSPSITFSDNTTQITAGLPLTGGTVTGNVTFSGATSGAITLAANAVAGTNTITLPASTGNIALTSQVIGISQTWQDVYSSRVAGTTYTNSTGKPIAVAISYTCNALNTVQGLTINGVNIYAAGYPAANGGGSGFSLIVPNGATYATLTNAGTMTIVTWSELR
jgi:hypothetical protein